MKSRTLVALAVGSMALFTASCNRSSEGGSAGTRDSFTLTAPTLSTPIKQGDRHTVKLELARGSEFKKNVAFQITEPKGLKVSIDHKTVSPSDPSEVSLTIEAEKGAPLGEQTIKVTGTPDSGSPTSVDVKVKVEEGPKR